LPTWFGTATIHIVSHQLRAEARGQLRGKTLFQHQRDKAACGDLRQGSPE
jgi:hypothetical protein